jgi:hypothetical protein
MGIEISEHEVRKLLQDEKLVNEVIAKVVEDPDVLDDLAEDVADELSDLLEDDPAFQQKIINVALANPEFKKRIVKELIDELGD